MNTMNTVNTEFELGRRLKKNSILKILNKNKPISAGCTLSAVNNQKLAATMQAVEKLICAVAGK